MSTLKATNIQNASSSSTNIVLGTSGDMTVAGTSTFGGNGTFSGTAVMSSPYTMRNKIINGAMVIDQRNAGASVTPANGAYTLDRWQYEASQASKFTAGQNLNSVTLPAGFSKYLGFQVASTASLAAGDYFLYEQKIEGFNCADLAWGTASAKTITISFWAYSSVTGTYSGAVANNSFNRSYIFTFSMPSANTWTYITVTVPGDTSGTWATDNTTGLFLRMDLGAGSTYTGSSGSWSGSTVWKATGSVSLVSNASATFYITGVQLERGTIATPFEYRNYQQELAMCQRYYEVTNYGGNGFVSCGQAISNSTAQAPLTWKVTKRAVSTIALSSTAAGVFQIYGANGANYNCTYAFSQISVDCCYINITGVAGNPLVAGNAALIYVNTGSQFISISAEL
jgi:hypothetical protein